MRALRIPAVVVMTVVLSMGLLLVGAGPAAAVTCSVPGTYPTIQSAVNDLSCTTIDVAAASYTENVVIGRALTLNGPNAGVSGAGARGPEATVLSFNITASSVIVDGFSFTNPGIQMNILGATTLSGVIVKNSIFSGYASVGFPTFNAGDLLVTRNLFENPVPGSEAMQIKAANLPGGGCSGTVVSDNVFRAASDNGSADINFSCTGSGSTDVTVSGNTDTGLTLGTSFTAFSGVVDGIVVMDNHVTGTPTAGSAIFFWGGVTGSVDILDNVITDFGGNGISVNNFLEGNNTATSTFTFNHNDLSGNGRSVYLGNAFDAGAMVAFHRNDLSGNTSTIGAQNDSTSLLADGTCNWWGSASGPNAAGNLTGTGDKAVGMIDYTPWLTTPNLDGPCVGGLPDGRVSGGGQINVTGGRASFGFNGRSENGASSGHLTYNNHASGAHLNCTVTVVAILSATAAHLEGTCSSKSSAPTFEADIQDNAEPGKNVDQFVIRYPIGGAPEGGPLRAGNIQIRSSGGAAAATTSSAGAGTFPAGATFNGISLSGLQVGSGLTIGSNGTATGQFVADLLGTSPLGQARTITVDGAVGSGSLGAAGSVTFSGVARVDIDDGSVPLLNVPFTATATTQSVLLSLGTSTLPSVPLTAGSITIE